MQMPGMRHIGAMPSSCSRTEHDRAVLLRRVGVGGVNRTLDVRERKCADTIGTCWFPGLAISNAKYKYIFFQINTRKQFIKQHSETVMI